MKKFDADTHVVAAAATGSWDFNGNPNEGQWISLEDWDSVTIVAAVGAVASQRTRLSVEQATAIAGTGAKALDDIVWFTAEAPSADTDDLEDVVTKNDAAAQSPQSTAGRAALFWCEITADQLDVSNGFKCLRVESARATNAASSGGLFYILRGGRYARSPEDQTTVLA